MSLYDSFQWIIAGGQTTPASRVREFCNLFRSLLL